MHAEQLIRMANQIGVFFEAMPDRAEALENTARHIKSFWEPRMRRALLAHVDAHAGAHAGTHANAEAGAHGAAQGESQAEPVLSDFVTEAVTRHRATLV